MKTLVERIRNRDLAIKNDGILEELRKVLKYCFPNNQIMPTGHCKYYFARHPQSIAYDYDTETILPPVSVKEVLAEIEREKVAKQCGISKDELNAALHQFSQVLHTVRASNPEPQTKVIYLNEEDKPKIEEPLGLINWFNKINKEEVGWHHQNYYSQNKYAEKWLTYRSNFKANDKPIEFEKVYILSEKDYQVCHNIPSNMDLVIVVDKETFIGIKTKEEYAQWRFKGNLNNGKVN